MSNDGLQRCMSTKFCRLTGQAFSLKEQIHHKVAYVQQHMTAQPDAPIAIIGHSIGKNMFAHSQKVSNATLATSTLSLQVHTWHSK